MDVGRVTTRTNSDYFLEAAGVGIDAGIVTLCQPHRQRRLERTRAPDTLCDALRAAHVYGCSSINSSLIVRAHMITVAIAPFAGHGHGGGSAGRCRRRSFRCSDSLGLYRAWIAAARHSYHRSPPGADPNIRTFRACSVKVGASRHQLQVHADARDMGCAPAHFEVVRGGLRVLARKDTPQPDRLG